MLLLVLSVACRQATLIPSESNDGDARSTEEVASDSVSVEADFEAEGWKGSIDVGFTFAGESEEGGNE